MYFDVPLCGGFLLTDRQDDLFDLFAGDEVAVYENVDDVADKAEYYLSKPDLRDSMLERPEKAFSANILTGTVWVPCLKKFFR